jgi:hypothetical protein
LGDWGGHLPANLNFSKSVHQKHLRAVRLEELRREIQKGIDSGDATPLDIEEIKAKGRSG